MNIFVLDEDPSKAAEYHVDRHVPAAIYELSQILTIAHVMLDGRGTAQSRVTLVDMNAQDRASMRQPYTSHPCAVWVRESRFNYVWTAKLLWELTKQFSERNGRGHEFGKFVLDYERYTPLNIPLVERTPFVQSMPVRFKGRDTVKAYREYYFATRQHLASWSNGRVPQWWTDMAGAMEVVNGR